ncbi:MAG: response regulator [Verrucomicrobiota bacterium]
MSPAQSNARPFRILCVEDEAAIRSLLQILLQREGYTVETAADGEAAWNIMSRDMAAFDLVITDNDMPKISGLELVERLRDAGYARHVVMFSGSITQQAGDRLARLNIAAVVVKGRAPLELLVQVRRLAAT